MSALPNPPSLVEYKNTRFLIFDAPTDQNLDLYIKEMSKFNVKHLVRACDPSYDTDKLTSAGIDIHEMPFSDGGAPPEEVVSDWMDVCKTAFKEKDATVAVHCVAGLGRAPVLVAVALISQGLSYDDAVSVIREKRRGAINAKQLKWLKTFKPKKPCIIM
jgi:protein tyrosine phosphatase type 4A